MDQKTPFSQALADHRVSVQVKDVDHYRIHGGMAVETDYIIGVEFKGGNVRGNEALFDPFTLSKTYSHFRTFAQQLKQIADGVMSSKVDTHHGADETTKKLGWYCMTVHHIIESQRHQYVGKVNYKYVKILAKKRTQIIKEILEATLNHFPTDTEESQFTMDVSHVIETLFLTDHCVEIDGERNDDVKNYSFAEIRSKNLVASGSATPPRPKLKFPTITIPSIPLLSKTPGGKPTSTVVLDSKTSTLSTSGGSTPVVPITSRRRSTKTERQADLDELIEVGRDANLLLDDERPQSELVPSYSAPVPTYNSQGSKIGNLFENNPIVFGIMTIILLLVLKRVGTMAVTVDFDVLLLFIWAAFCIGLHSPRPMIRGIEENYGPQRLSSGSKASGTDRRELIRSMKRGVDGAQSSAEASDIYGRKLLHRVSKMSLRTQKAIDLDDDISTGSDTLSDIQSPLPVFPKGAALGSHFNCWSQPVGNDFHIRGPRYLFDKVKIESGDFLWQVRGVDLFLTDTPPENAGRLPEIMGGRLREVPTFLINFRLPWGVLLAYFEIPEMYIPFIKAGHDPEFNSALPSTQDMTPAERCTARYCRSSAQQKDRLLKIVPVVVDGPWVVKMVVRNKRAILGTKMPVNYIYQKEEEGKSMYLEMDLDIVASSAARGILSLVRTYTNVITLDLGFVVQGNHSDELPEQMLAGARLHGLDPLNAPALPVSQEQILSNLEAAEQDDDATE
mmetsp:Transcript_5935/g.16892  ORF Transcript_5935/g.16892 Transcript_5935/m.16892 type:complete len:731 (+) Transcript_5935:213-2405(+)